jgi:nucleotide-binding universal stress UspA family protein
LIASRHNIAWNAVCTALFFVPLSERTLRLAHVSHKLSNSLEGALAGGGDPATSPLYVFGPFLKLIVVAGVAQVTFGASVWLVILTIAVVSAMYRLVMRWVTDGSGGSGLSEEEFGGWAVKINAAITFTEYSLTFLVSMAAMVTFIADRLPFLNQKILWLQYRTFVAIGLSILTGWLVNQGPKMAARTFGPATAGVLLLLWVMVFATVARFGIKLPAFDLRAFNLEYLEFTVGGYARILAVMTGIEVFANLVAAYDGNADQKSAKAFYSLLIIMGTTAITMLIVGPAIFSLSNPTDPHVSVFTQTMDQLLPPWLSYFGTFVGIAVLMSASAASAQGLQNLALGLGRRRYVPPIFSQRNRFGVAEMPVWLEVGIVSFCFLFLGTHEETYLAIYAAGVFILLSMTGWAVFKRLVREIRTKLTAHKVIVILGTVVAALLTTSATVVIFYERFFEGAWTYLIFIPVLYWMFSYSRQRMGEPTPEEDYLGLLDAAQLAGFGFGQAEPVTSVPRRRISKPVEMTWQAEPKSRSKWREQKVEIKRIAVLLDGSYFAAQAIPLAKLVATATQSQLTLLSAVKDHTATHQEQDGDSQAAREIYLINVEDQLREENINVNHAIRPGFIADATKKFVNQNHIDMVITTTRGKSGAQHWLTGGVSRKLAHNLDVPILLMKALNGDDPTIDRILVALDGSIKSEHVLPYARNLAKTFNSELILISVPAIPEVSDYRAPADVIEKLRHKAEVNMHKFLEAVARTLREDGLQVKTLVTGNRPAITIVEAAEQVDADMIMITSRGRGGMDLFMMGSVAHRIVEHSDRMVLLVPVHKNSFLK